MFSQVFYGRFNTANIFMIPGDGEDTVFSFQVQEVVTKVTFDNRF
jgi:hypothetical protein